MSICHELYEAHYKIRKELDHKVQGEAYQGDVREQLEGVVALMDAARTELDTLPGHPLIFPREKNHQSDHARPSEV